MTSLDLGTGSASSTNHDFPAAKWASSSIRQLLFAINIWMALAPLCISFHAGNCQIETDFCFLLSGGCYNLMFQEMHILKLVLLGFTKYELNRVEHVCLLYMKFNIWRGWFPLGELKPHTYWTTFFFISIIEKLFCIYVSEI